MFETIYSKIVELEKVGDAIKKLFEDFCSIEYRDLDDETLQLLSRLEDKGYDCGLLAEELNDAVEMLDDAEIDDFTKIDPKKYIYWLYNSDTENNKVALIEELAFWNKGK